MAASICTKASKSQHQANCKAIKHCTGINMPFTTDNLKKWIASDIQYLNSRTKTNSISTYDFTSIYTKNPYSNLAAKLECYIYLAFWGSNK